MIQSNFSKLPALVELFEAANAPAAPSSYYGPAGYPDSIWRTPVSATYANIPFTFTTA